MRPAKKVSERVFAAGNVCTTLLSPAHIPRDGPFAIYSGGFIRIYSGGFTRLCGTFIIIIILYF